MKKSRAGKGQLSTIKFIKKDGSLRVLEGRMAKNSQPYLCRLGTVTMVEQLRTSGGQFAGNQFRNVRLDSILPVEN